MKRLRRRFAAHSSHPNFPAWYRLGAALPRPSNVLQSSRSMRVTVTTSPGVRSASIRRSCRRSAFAPVTDLATFPGPMAHYQRMMAGHVVQRTLEIEAAIGYNLSGPGETRGWSEPSQP